MRHRPLPANPQEGTKIREESKRREEEQNKVPALLGIKEVIWDKGKPPLKRTEIKLQQEEWMQETTLSIT